MWLYLALQMVCRSPTESRAATAVLVVTAPVAQWTLTPAQRRRVRVVELRLDHVPQPSWLEFTGSVRDAVPQAQVLATVRRRIDGGRWPDGCDRTEVLNEFCREARPDLVDLEHDAAERTFARSIAGSGTHIVLSRHDFEPVDPRDLGELLADLDEVGRHIGASHIKWAGTSHDGPLAEDIVLRFCAASSAFVPRTAFLMGDLHRATRVMAALLGGGFAYGHDGRGEAAPGMIFWPVLEALLGSIPAGDPMDPAWREGVRRALQLAESVP